ncbi:MAG TPA: hypothetical protein VMU93_13000 [Caulobacteraceae bacterium]|nr:hypothetical protein [Caulobacteraceae bacterium]
MAEVSFEARLERMFADAPAMADAELFAVRAQDRLERGWNARRVLIGAMGVAGGLVGSAQVLGAGATGHLEALGAESNAFLTRHLQLWLPAGVAADSRIVWMALALAAVGVGLGLARAIREI